MYSSLNDSIWMMLAIAAAEPFIGMTAPNPPVGACLVKDNRLLAVGEHHRAGDDHAEVVALKRAWARYGAECAQGATMYSTLEPCNHSGRTPPCARTLIAARVERVVYGVDDIHAKAAGGALALRGAGISVTSGVALEDCLKQLRPFLKLQQKKQPWIVHKLAWRIGADDTLTMRPQPGSTTFTSAESLAIAHTERRQCDAIVTGIGTVLADAPRFTVRAVPDHPHKRRRIAVVSRSGQQAPPAWIQQQIEAGHEVLHCFSFDSAVQTLGELGCLRVLVEAGPALSQAIESEHLWDERLQFIHQSGKPDIVTRELACSAGS